MNLRFCRWQTVVNWASDLAETRFDLRRGFDLGGAPTKQNDANSKLTHKRPFLRLGYTGKSLR